MCRRSVSGKVLFSSWRRRVHGAVDDNDINRLITHVRCDAGILPAIAERFAGAAKMSQSIRNRVKFGVGASAYRYEFPEGTRGASE